MSRINIEDSFFNDQRVQALFNKIGKIQTIGYFVLLAKAAQQYFLEGQNIPEPVWEMSEYPKEFIDVGLVEKRENGYYLVNSESHFKWLLAKKKNGEKGGRPSENKDLKKATDNLSETEGKLSESYKNPPTPTPTPTLTNKYNGLFKKIIDHLNKSTGSSFRHTTKKTQQLINARLEEGFGYEDFIKVIDFKTNEWIQNTDMCKYLRPETLFGNKFEGYLQAVSIEAVAKNKKTQAKKDLIKFLSQGEE